MAVKCTECGASIQDDSKFCKYCGAKIVQEDLKRVEVKIDDTAEIRRAGYEEAESKIRQKMMKRELRTKGLKWKICGVLFLIGFSVLIPAIISGEVHSRQATGIEIAGMALCGIVVLYVVLEWLHKIMQ